MFNWPGFIYLTPYILSSLICLGVSLYSFRRRDQAGAWPLTFLTIFEIVWCGGYILQLMAPGLNGKLFWNNVQFIGAIGAPIAYFAFAFEFTRRKLKRSTWNVIISLAIVILLFVWTDGFHHLFRANPHLVAAIPYSNLIFDNGPVFNIYPFFAYIILIVGTYALVKNYLSSSRAFRLQVGTVLFGAAIPWIVTLITWFNILPISFEKVTLISFAASNLILFWALFRFRLFDLVPIAYASLVDSIEDGIIVLNYKNNIVDLNPAALRIFNLKLDQALGKPVYQELPILQDVLPKVNGKGSTEVDFDINIDGAIHILEVRTFKIYDSPEQLDGLLVLLRDITERKRVEGKLQLMAITDPLTNIFNRRYFFELTEREFERSRRTSHQMSIVIFDIDNFKRVNDSFGHLIGDQVLQSLTRRCQESLREYDLMARYGGEEFIILLPETDAQQAFQVAERLREKIAEIPFVAGKASIDITVSLGISDFKGEDDLTVDKLVDRADQTLLNVKQNGRNQVRIWETKGQGQPNA